MSNNDKTTLNFVVTKDFDDLLEYAATKYDRTKTSIVIESVCKFINDKSDSNENTECDGKL